MRLEHNANRFVASHAERIEPRRLTDKAHAREASQKRRKEDFAFHTCERGAEAVMLA